MARRQEAIRTVSHPVSGARASGKLSNHTARKRPVCLTCAKHPCHFGQIALPAQQQLQVPQPCFPPLCLQPTSWWEFCFELFHVMNRGCSYPLAPLQNVLQIWRRLEWLEAHYIYA